VPVFRPCFPALVLLCSAPLFGQGTSYFQVCNAGKVAVDAYLSIEGKITNKHIGPADCDFLMKSTGRLDAGTLGFGFPDAKGQWRGARRGDLLPFWEADLGGDNFSAVKRTQAVQHNGASVTIPMIVAFGPKTPDCSQPVRTSAVSQLPLNASASQRLQAQMADQQAASNSAPICSSVGFQLTVIPYTDSQEIGYDTQCDACSAKQVAGMTSEQKTAEERRSTLIESQAVSLAAAGGVGGLMMRTVLQGAAQVEKEEAQNQRDRAEIAKGPWAMTWQKYSSFTSSAFGPRGTRPLIANRHIIMRGTVSRLELPNPGAQTPWIHVYFKDSASIPKPPPDLPGDYFVNDWLRAGQPEGAFAICELGADVFPELFGANWSTAMVGKTVEFEGELNRGTCATAAGIRISLARQLKIVTPNLTASTGRAWDASMAPPRPTGGVVTPPPVQPPTPASRPGATRTAGTRAETPAPATPPAATPAPVGAKGGTAAVAPVPAAAAPTPAVVPATVATVRAPAAVPAPEAVPPRPASSPVVENVIRMLQAKVDQYRILDQVRRTNQPHTLTGDERGRLEDAGASERLMEAIEKPSEVKPEELRPVRSPAARQELAGCLRRAAQENRGNPEGQLKALQACQAAAK
jgi:hypothetical protein